MSLLNETSHFKKVLVIDDNEVDRYMAGQCIERYGFAEEVVLKESASKALVYLMSLEHAPKELPQMIFLAESMIEIKGFVFLEHYQKLPEKIKVNCAIVIITSSTNTHDPARCKTNQYIKIFLNKPLNKEKLQAITLEIPTKILRKQSHAA